MADRIEEIDLVAEILTKLKQKHLFQLNANTTVTQAYVIVLLTTVIICL